MSIESSPLSQPVSQVEAFCKRREFRGKDSKEDQSADVEIDEQIVEWLEEGHKPQNVMIVTGDKGYKGSLEKLVERGHTTIVVRRDELQEGAKTRWAKIKKAKYLWGWKTFLGVSEEGPTREEQRFAKFVARKKKEKSEEAKQIVKERKARQKENRRIRRVAESQEKTERKAEESENKKRKAEESEIGNNKKKRKKKKKAKPITGPYAKKPI